VQHSYLGQAVETHNNPPRIFHLPSDEIGVVKQHSITDEFYFHPLDLFALNSQLTRWVVPQKTRQVRGAAVVDDLTELPLSLVKAYVGMQWWPGVPRVTRMATAPVVRPDWTVAWEAGYDAGSTVYITEASAPFDAELNQANVGMLVSWLRGFFAPFAFEHETSWADALGLALTPIIVSALPQSAPVPGGIITANKPGSGKTVLAQVIASMGSGVPATPQPLPSVDGMKTHVTTLLNGGGKPVVVFDNVKASLDSDALESLLTSRTWIDRKFRTQEDFTLRNDTQWLFTLNGATASPDMIRRLVMIPLDVERSGVAWDPLIMGKVLANLKMLRAALVVLVEWWVKCGKPVGSQSRSGFEDWFETVSGILEAAGVEGFNAAYEDTAHSVYNADEDLADIVERIARVMGTGSAWKSGELWNSAYDVLGAGLSSAAMADRQALADWLKAGDANGARGGSTKVGRVLQQLVGKVLPGADYTIEAVKLGTQSRSYQVVPKPGAPQLVSMSTAGTQSF
jgi:hypothetical protein